MEPDNSMEGDTMGDAEQGGDNAPQPTGLRGRTCVVTGATSGIGKETALGLAHLGGTVILAGRNPEKGEQVRQEIVSRTGSSSVDFMVLDLSSQASIRAFVEAFKAGHHKLHVLVNNAGLYTRRRNLTVDGFESTFAVNHLGSFLLTNLLVDLIKASAPARIISVASEAQRSGRIDFDDPQLEKNFSGFRAYTQSKLANIMFTYELARRLEGTGVTANCLHPGGVRTNFAGQDGGIMRILMRMMWPLLLSPERGAQTPLYLASSAEVEGVTGGYFIKGARARSSPLSYDEEACRKLWEMSAQLMGLRP